MDKDKFINDVLDIEWQEDDQEKEKQDDNQIGGLFQYRDYDIFSSDDHKKQHRKETLMQKEEEFFYSPLSKQQMITQIEQQQKQQTSTQKYGSVTNLSNVPKDAKNEKQQLYSKVYRKKKKQKYRFLQDENEYLRKRIKQLESQLRQQEIELNRFKFPPPQKQLSVEELNQQFAEMSKNMLEQYKNQPQEYHKQQFPTQNFFHQFFLQCYAERGFAGRKKLKILNYHFNQILESVLKDSEKYLSLVYARSQSYDKLVPLPQFEPINNIFLEIYKPEGNLWSRLKTFHKFLKPMSLQLNLHISQFCKKFQDILSCCKIIHNLVRETYLTNMDVARRRIQLEIWFDFSKYGKLMRRLKFKWFQWMKSLAQKEDQENKTAKRTYKKKKILQ